MALLCAAGNTCTVYKVMASRWTARSSRRRRRSAFARRGAERGGSCGRVCNQQLPADTGTGASHCNERTSSVRPPNRVPRGRSSRNRSRGPITRTSSLPGRLASHWEQGIWHRSSLPPPVSLPLYIKKIGQNRGINSVARATTTKRLRRIFMCISHCARRNIPIYIYIYILLICYRLHKKC